MVFSTQFLHMLSCIFIETANINQREKAGAIFLYLLSISISQQLVGALMARKQKRFLIWIQIPNPVMGDGGTGERCARLLVHIVLYDT